MKKKTLITTLCLMCICWMQALCCNVTVSTSNGQILVSGLTGTDNTKLFDANINDVWTCNPWNGNLCTASESITGLTIGATYFLSVEGATCSEWIPVIVIGGGTTATCTDGIQNQDETGIDCGGASCPPCQTNGCNVNVIFSSNNVNVTGLTNDVNAKLFDANYTSVWECNPWNGTPCSSSEDIAGLAAGTYYFSAVSDQCDEWITITLTGGPVGATCTDGIQNQDETGIDCGGSNCPPCQTTGCNIFYSIDGNTVTVFGLPSDANTKLFDENYGIVWECNPWNGNPCTSTVDIQNVGIGNYFLSVQSTDCDEWIPIEIVGETIDCILTEQAWFIDFLNDPNLNNEYSSLVLATTNGAQILIVDPLNSFFEWYSCDGTFHCSEENGATGCGSTLNGATFIQYLWTNDNFTECNLLEQTWYNDLLVDPNLCNNFSSLTLANTSTSGFGNTQVLLAYDLSGGQAGWYDCDGAFCNEPISNSTCGFLWTFAVPVLDVWTNDDCNNNVSCEVELENFSGGCFKYYDDGSFSSVDQSSPTMSTQYEYDADGNLNTILEFITEESTTLEISNNTIVETTTTGAPVTTINIDPNLVSTYTAGINYFAPKAERTASGEILIIGIIPDPAIDLGSGPNVADFEVYIHKLDANGNELSGALFATVTIPNLNYTNFELEEHIIVEGILPTPDGGVNILLENIQPIGPDNTYITGTAFFYEIDPSFQNIQESELSISTLQGIYNYEIVKDASCHVYQIAERYISLSSSARWTENKFWDYGVAPPALLYTRFNDVFNEQQYFTNSGIEIELPNGNTVKVTQRVDIYPPTGPEEPILTITDANGAIIEQDDSFPVLPALIIPDGNGSFNYIANNTLYNFNCEETPMPSVQAMNSKTEVPAIIFNNMFPNPTSDELFIKLESNLDQSAEIQIFDAVGKLYLFKKADLEVGMNTISIATSQLYNGIYNLVISDKDGILHTNRFVKQ